jgi:FkbM family methyltransferase
MAQPSPSGSASQYEDWERQYLDSLGGNPNSARAKRSRIEKVTRRFARQFFHPEDFFLRHISGVVHVGAHAGQECDRYSEHGLKVLWIEPNPRIFQTLTKAIRNYAGQTALSYLVADVDNKDCSLHISSNNGASSSIFEFGGHKEIWPEVTFMEEIPLKTITLSSMVAREKVDMSRYDALVMDTQGSELLVLKGAADLLSQFKFIKTEAADFEVYKGCCTVKDLDAFLDERGFERVCKKPFASKSGVGACYDLVYSRESWKRLRNLF